MNTSWIIPIATLLLGALVGFFFRSREFRREQRLKVYGEFVAAFLASAHAGAVLLNLHASFGDSLYNENRDKATESWADWVAATALFEESTLRLRLIASKDVRTASEELEDFIARNIRAVPPFTRGARPEDWGESAQVGPAHVDRAAMVMARDFADRASRDVTFSRER